MKNTNYKNFTEVSYPMIVGGYLKRKLRSGGITQESFSFDYGVDVRTVRRWIRDGVHSLDTVVEIAQYFGVSVWDVLSDEGDIPFYMFLYTKKPTQRGQKVSFWSRLFYVTICFRKSEIIIDNKT